MAQVDASIALGARPPDFQGYELRKAQINALASAEEERRLKREAEQVALGERNALRAILSDPANYGADGSLDLSRVAPKLYAAAPGKGGSVVESLRKDRKMALDESTAGVNAETAKVKAAAEKLALIGQIAGAAVDQPSYERGIAQLQQLGIPVDGIPPQFDPAVVKQFRDQVLTAQQQTEMEWKRQIEASKSNQWVDIPDKTARGQLMQVNRVTGEKKAVGAGPQVVVQGPAGAGKPPAGYRFTPDGDLQAIPGGPADTKQQGQFNQDTASLQGASASLDQLAKQANLLLNHKGLSRITGIQGALPNVPGMAGADADAMRTTLLSQVGFGALQAMRDASKTGGALGQVTEKELTFLQNSLTALEKPQSEEQFRSELQRLIKWTQDSKERLRGAYNMKHGEGRGAQPTSPSGRKPLSAFGG
jgi:hypothetical protein